MHSYGYAAVMGGGGIFDLLVSLVVLADLILLGAFLWKQIQKK